MFSRYNVCSVHYLQWAFWHPIMSQLVTTVLKSQIKEWEQERPRALGLTVDTMCTCIPVQFFICKRTHVLGTKQNGCLLYLCVPFETISHDLREAYVKECLVYELWNVSQGDPRLDVLFCQFKHITVTPLQAAVPSGSLQVYSNILCARKGTDIIMIQSLSGEIAFTRHSNAATLILWHW